MISAKKKSIFVKLALVVFTALIAIACFLLSPKKITAGAVTSSDNTKIYFANGAGASVETTDVLALRFNFYLSEEAVADEDDVLLIQISDIPSAKIKFVGASCWKDDRFNGYNRIYDNDEDFFYRSDRVVGINSSSFDFNDGWMTFYVIVSVDDIYQEVKVGAGMVEDGCSTVSDSRSLIYVWERAITAGDEAILMNPYVSEIVEFCNGVDKDKLLVSSAFQMSQGRGFTVQANIPKEIREKLYNPIKSYEKVWNSFAREYTTHPYWEEYYVSVVFQKTPSNVSGRNSIWFSAKSNTASGTLTGYELPSSFKSNSVGFFDVSIPAKYMNYVSIEVYKRSTHYKVVETSNWWEWKKEFTDELVATSENYQEFSIVEIAQEMLMRDLTLNEAEEDWLKNVAGITPTANTFPITVKYKRMNEYASVEDVEEQVFIPSEWAFDVPLVESMIYQYSSKFRSLADFNITYSGRYYENGYAYDTESRIVLQALGLGNYTYDTDAQSGTIEVLYDDYKYKDLCIRITNNDAENHLTMNYYTTNVYTDGNVTTITFDMNTIETQLLNACIWIFDMQSGDIVFNDVDGVTVVVGEDNIAVTVENGKENNLLHLSLTAVAEIIEDFEAPIAYKYNRFVENEKGELRVETVTMDAGLEWYSNIINIRYERIFDEIGDELEEAVTFERLEGKYLEPISCHRNDVVDKNGERSFEIVIDYNEYTIFKITDNLAGKPYYKQANRNSYTYEGEFFVAKESIPKGYRVQKICSTSSNVDITSEENYVNSSVFVEVNQSVGRIIPISITYTDSWYMLVNYMQQIAGTPFAELKSQKTQIRVADYEDIYALTEDDLKKILKVTSFDITSMVTLDKISVTFDNVSLYTVDVSYTQASLRMLNYEGETEELKVPLTSYADWCASFGKDWTILMLNQPGKTYFRFDNTVAREKLYGLFSVAVFSEQVSDLNYWFKNTTGDGQITMFSAKKTEGSAVYKFFDNLRTKDLLMSVAGHVGMALCEILNDENQMLHSYYLYLDGTNPNGAYVSNGGADDAFDDDTAIENKGEDIVEDIKNAVSGFKESTFGKVLTVLVAVLTGTGFVIVIIWLLKKLNLLPKRRAKTSKTKRSSKPKAKRSKAKAK